MKTFTRTDLSTYKPQASMDFYQSVLWRTYHGDEYALAWSGDREVAAIFESPEFLQKIEMPSFWMSYILVEDVAATTKLAEQYGAKIELWPMTDQWRTIALIRDPSGAGFTIMQGEMWEHRSATHWCPIRNELYVDEIHKVREFYTQVFGREIVDTGGQRYDVLSEWQTIAAIQALSDDDRGHKQRWTVFFAVDNIEHTKTLVMEAGGTLTSEFKQDGHRCLSCMDTEWAAVVYMEV